VELYKRIAIKLEFFEPWEATHTTTFTFEPTPEGGTTVRWAMDGQNTFMGKAFALFANMDELLGKDFEQGLAAMKDLAETEAKKPAYRPKASGIMGSPGNVPMPAQAPTP
jgi:hypothetical protein